jgi:hypothetical protein
MYTFAHTPKMMAVEAKKGDLPYSSYMMAVGGGEE